MTSLFYNRQKINGANKMQKKIALINDVTGFGRCSIAVMAPIVSAMKIQAVTVPTAILSAHTQFPEYYFDDYKVYAMK